ncbi:MAG: LamG-like jellyroll fold domain-containing protein [Bacteroidota bacterium]
MKHLLVLLVFVTANCIIQAQNIWSESNAGRQNLTSPKHEQLPAQFRLVQLNNNQLKSTLNGQQRTQRCLDIPLPDGSEECFILEETYLLPKKVMAKYPDLRTFTGSNISQSQKRIHLVQSKDNFHVIGESEQGTFFIDKVSKEGEPFYISYYAKDDTETKFTCGAKPARNTAEPSNTTAGRQSTTKSWGTELRKLRLAIMWTPSQVAAYGNDTTAMLNRNAEIIADLNFVYERDLAISFELAIHPELLIFPDNATSPYKNSNIGTITPGISNAIGVDNFDIGFALVNGLGGSSWLNVTCVDATKAGTRSGNRHFAIVHEIGHNMGAEHTFSYCPNSPNGLGVEPGPGNSIMSYAEAGGCPYDLLIPEGRIDYFHSASIDQMTNHVFGVHDCSAKTTTGNTPPMVSIPASGFSIPVATPFTLTGAATDTEDASKMTYIWEQMDKYFGANPTTPAANSPLFQMFPPTNSPSRTFPKMESILNGYTYGEILPQVARELNFRFTARDNHAGASGIAYENLSFSVSDAAGPFVVTYPNQTETWSVGQTYDVTWEVANTNQAPVNCQIVDILLSSDGGYTYPDTLAKNVPNDGQQTIIVPNKIGSQNRIKVAAADNIFFDISNENFSIVAANSYDFAAKITNPEVSICDENSATFHLTTNALGTFNATLDLQLSNLPTNATLNMPAQIAATGNQSITIDNLNAIAAGRYNLTLTLTETGGSVTKDLNLLLVKKANAIANNPGQAVDFDGTSSQIRITKNDTDFNFAADQDFSIEFWMKLPDTTRERVLIADKIYNNTNSKGWGFGIFWNSIFFKASDGLTPFELRATDKTYDDGNWHHLAVSISRTGSSMGSLYIDGVLKEQLSVVGLGDLSTATDIVMGADLNNQLPFRGSIDEFRIWKKALTQTEVRENMHRILDQNCGDLISTYQFNKTNGDALDAISHHHGTLNNVTRIASTVPIGFGQSDSQSEQIGTVNFLPVGLSANYTEQAAQSITATKINRLPFGMEGVGAGENILDSSYWVLNRYENEGVLDFQATFMVNQDISAAQASQTINFKIYGRDYNAYGSWTLLANAAAVNPTTNSITFSNIRQYGQYLLTNSSNPAIAISPLNEAICPTIVNSLSPNTSQYTIQGINLSSDIIITPPVGIEMSLTADDGFSNDPITLSPVDETVAERSLYVRFRPTETGNYSQNINHITTGTSVVQPIQTVVVPAASDTAGIAYQGRGTQLPYLTIPSLEWQPTQFTIEFWLKPYALAQWNQMIGIGWGTFLFHADHRGAVYAGTDLANRVVAPDGTLQINQWSHLAITFDHGHLKLYQNGRLVTSQTGAALPDAWDGNFAIGVANPTNNINGLLDEFRIWETARTPQQIQENMHHTLEVAAGCGGDLELYYQFETMAVDSVPDVVGKHTAHSYLGINFNDDFDIDMATEPVGEGIANSQTEAVGTVNFPNTDCSIEYTSQNGATVVVSKISVAPSGLDSLPATITPFSQQYWVMHRYGTGALTMNITFTVAEDLTTIDADNPQQIGLYGRNAPSDDNWTLITTASNIDATTNTVTFNEITTYQQFLVARSPSTCNDGIQNGDETGVDCGGTCPPCVEDCPVVHTETPDFFDETATVAAVDSITSTATISRAANVTFQAGKAIILKAGFEVSNGSTFLAKIADCTPNDSSLFSRVASDANNTTSAVTINYTHNVGKHSSPQLLSLSVYPNPTRYSTTITFELSHFSQNVQLQLFNLQGKQLQSWYNGSALAQGYYTIPLAGESLEAGLYVLRLRTNDGVRTLKLVVQR